MTSTVLLKIRMFLARYEVMWNFYSIRVFVVNKKVQGFGTKANGFKEDLQIRVIFT